MATADLDENATGKKSGHGHHLRCVVVTPERTLFDNLVEFVSLPLFDGELGVLPGRSPLIGRLGFGELRTKVGGTARRYFVDGGFAQVRDDVVTVLTNHATPAEAIDPEAAARDLDHAKTHKVTTEVAQAEKTRSVDRARALVRVGMHRES